MNELLSTVHQEGYQLAPLRLGLWAIEQDEQSQYRFTTNSRHREYLHRLLEQLLSTTDFQFVIPLDCFGEFDRLLQKTHDRVKIFRPAQSASEDEPTESNWVRGALLSPCDAWICPGLEYRNLIDQMKGLPIEEIGRKLSHFTPADLDSTAIMVLNLQQSLATHLGKRVEYSSWTPTCTTLLKAFRRAIKPKPATIASRPDRFKLTLFLGNTYFGGVWESIRQLMFHLVEINQNRAELELTLLVTPTQDVSGLEPLGKRLRIGRIEWRLIPAHQAVWDNPGAFPGQSEAANLYCWPEPAEPKSNSPDALFAMTDRFNVPLSPRVPFGVWIYDMIQLDAPDCFDASFWEAFEKGMRPSLKLAELSLVPSRAVLEAARRGYQLPEKRFKLIPVSCEPQSRFGSITPVPIAKVNRPYFLHVANAAPHKGGALVINATQRLKDLLQGEAPLMVLCGPFTDQYSADYQGKTPYQHCIQIQQQIKEMGLVEGVDVLFLGNVGEPELMWLYEHTLGVINAAKFDNGSFNMVEGHYFGRPIISSDYPGARILAERFEIPTRFFPVDDVEALVVALQETRIVPAATPAELTQIRAKLTNPEYSIRTQAERFYDLLVEIGRRGYERKLLNGSFDH